MEYFAKADAHMSPTDLQRFVRIQNLPVWCASIEKVTTQSAEKGSLSWAGDEYAVHQEVVRNGIHFSLPGSEDVMQWSITAEPNSKNGRVTIHCTINRQNWSRNTMRVCRGSSMTGKQGWKTVGRESRQSWRRSLTWNVHPGMADKKQSDQP